MANDPNTFTPGCGIVIFGFLVIKAIIDSLSHTRSPKAWWHEETRNFRKLFHSGLPKPVKVKKVKPIKIRKERPVKSKHPFPLSESINGAAIATIIGAGVAWSQLGGQKVHTGYRCADGWMSYSIGRQGACSHHGGVVSYEIDPRTELEKKDCTLALMTGAFGGVVLLIPKKDKKSA